MPLTLPADVPPPPAMPEVEDFLAALAPLLPHGWRASLQLQDPLIQTLEEVATWPAGAGDGKTHLLSLVAVPEGLDRPPGPWLLARLSLAEARVFPLVKERPFGRLLLVAEAGAPRLTEVRAAAVEALCRDRAALLDRARAHREEERFTLRLRRLIEDKLAVRLTEACVELLPDAAAAAVLLLSEGRLKVVRVRHEEGELADELRRRDLPFHGSHLEALTQEGTGGDRTRPPRAALTPAEIQQFGEGRLFTPLLMQLLPQRVETVPLEPGGRLAGSLVIFHRRADGSPEERSAVDHLAGALSIALERTRPERRHASRLLYLQEILHGSTEGGFEAILETVVEEMIQYLGADAGVLALLDSETGKLLLSEHAGYEESVLPDVIPLVHDDEEGHSISARVVRTGEPYVASYTRESPVYMPADRTIRSEMAVPLRLRGEVIGVALASSRTEGYFLPEDVPRFQLLADQVAVAVDNGRLLESLERRRAERSRVAVHTRAEDLEYHFGAIVGDPAGPMGEVYRIVERVAPREQDTVLITGETGTGKEVVAQAIHRASPRRGQPLVATNFAALGGDPNLIQSELFGHEKGAFTGAVRRRRGAFEKAHRSTLLIDELGDVVPAAQVKLLRVLGRASLREFQRLGGEELVRSDVRVLAATHQDLLAEAGAGRFRLDLYYRVSALVVRIPPLRERPGDIPLLARHFLAQLAGPGARLGLSRPTEEALVGYGWPGNVRQLESVLLRALVMFGEAGQVSASDVRQALAIEEEQIDGGVTAEPIDCPEPPPADWFWSKVWEPFKAHRLSAPQVKELIERTLAETGGFYTRTAERLGVAREDYQRFLDFLTHQDLKVDWRPFRRPS